MTNSKLAFYILSLMAVVTQFSHAGASKDNKSHPMYFGSIVGYGSTTWEGLVPAKNNQNEAISLSTPVNVIEGGIAWGFFAGYEVLPTFAVETTYLRYPNATVTFDELSLFTFNHDGKTSFITRTELASIMGKIMFLVPHTKALRIYSSAGAAGIHREDLLADYWRATPTFGAGINYKFTSHVMGEFGANYTAGYGESNLNPTDSYFPFLYSITVKLAYCV